MFRTKSKFDYQAVIEACGIQDVNIKKGVEEKNVAVTKFQDQFTILKNLIKEKDEKHENLSKLKLTLNKNLQKLNKTHNKISISNNEHKALQVEILRLNLELQQASNDFVKKMANMDEELKILFSEFQGEALTVTLSNLNTDLLSVQDAEAHLQQSYEELKQSSIHSDSVNYERPNILKSPFSYLSDTMLREEIERKLINKNKNRQFLTTEFNKISERLQKLSL